MSKAFRLSFCAPVLLAVTPCFYGCDSGNTSQQGAEVGKPAMTPEQQTSEAAKREEAMKNAKKAGARK
jgi:hypothetical protein